jgi:glycosyltransferase involved in cell wall biosynthesis
MSDRSGQEQESMPTVPVPNEPIRPKVLIFIVAYEAEATLQQVLARIPDDVFREFATEVLVIDDASRDRTFEMGVRSAAASRHRINVLYNAVNQGYGGNQKLGYQYALRHGFDFVVLLHGDGQYAPERIPVLLAPLVEDKADAVFGSRMLVRHGALRGGMPLYKYVGNKILTTAQNALLGANLSEFHSGFRAYRVATLGRLPFEYNSNAFHFDTEIIIQLLMARCRVVEVPIPTYYGAEICRVNGIRYAKDVMLATLGSRLHRMNLFYDRRFDVEGRGNTHYTLKLGYRSSHTMALDAVPPGARVLDIGCGPGEFAKLLAAKGCRVDGADQFPPTTPIPFEGFVRWSEGEPFAADLHDYDYVLLLDILEHLKDPESFLDQLRRRARRLDRRPRFVVTTGNVVFLVVRMQALLGHFNYGKRGILDMTHTRLYTFKTLRRLFEQCGFIVEEVKGIPAPFPVAIGMNALSRLMVRFNSLLIRLSKGLFSYQIFMRVAPMASVDALLDDSIGGSRDRVAAALASGSVREGGVVASVGPAARAPHAAQPTSTR